MLVQELFILQMPMGNIGGIESRAITGVTSGDALGGDPHWKDWMYASTAIKTEQTYQLFGFDSAGTDIWIATNKLDCLFLKNPLL